MESRQVHTPDERFLDPISPRRHRLPYRLTIAVRGLWWRRGLHYAQIADVSSAPAVPEVEQAPHPGIIVGEPKRIVGITPRRTPTGPPGRSRRGRCGATVSATISSVTAQLGLLAWLVLFHGVSDAAEARVAENAAV